MEVEDKSRIKRIVFKYPKYMSERAEEFVKEDYYSIVNLENELADLRMRVNDLEKILKNKKEAFRHISNAFDLEFETKHIEYKTNICSLGIVNPTDASNPNYGK